MSDVLKKSGKQVNSAHRSAADVFDRTSNMRSGPLILALLSALYLLLTNAVDWKYSVDLTVLQDVAGNYPFKEDFFLALVDNSAIVWLALKGDWLADPEVLLKIIYWLAFLLKTILFIRVAGVRATIAFTALFFFSIDLNQARMSLAISFLLIGYSFACDRRLWAIPAVAAAIICHYPAALVLILFFAAARHPKIALASAALSIALVAIALLGEDSPILRYLAYVEDTGEGGQASFFAVTAILSVTFWRELSPLQRGIIVLSIAVSFLMRDLLNLSGRVSELSATALLLWSYRANGGRRALSSPTTVFMLVGVLFFFYRFGQWVLLDQVPQPSNL